MKKRWLILLPFLLSFVVLLSGCEAQLTAAPTPSPTPVALEEVPAYSGSPYVEVEGNQPTFLQEELTTTSFESYSPLDSLGRCGVAFACVGKDLMPTQDREDISSVHPTGWVQNQYDFVDGGSLYNRCHLIGFQLNPVYECRRDAAL